MSLPIPSELALNLEQDPAYVAAVWKQRAAERRRRRGSERAHVRPEQDQDQERYLLTRIGAQVFAFPLANVVAVTPLPATVGPIRLPDAPPEFWGLLTLRGEVRPVFDGAALFQSVAADGATTDSDETEGAERGSQILLLKPVASAHVDEEMIGLRVDRAEQVAQFARKDASQMQSGKASNSTTGWTRGALPLSASPANASEERSPVAFLVDTEALLAHFRGTDAAQNDVPSLPDSPDSEAAVPGEDES